MIEAGILIVEDESIIAMDIRQMLRIKGFNVLGMAKSGEEAVDMAEELNPSLILMDIELKGEIDGIEAANLIKSRADLPVIFLTAHSDEVTLNRAKTAEPYGYILKPVDEDDLYTAIITSLYKHKIEINKKTAQQEIEKTYMELDQIFNSSISGMCVIGRNHEFLNVNKSFLNILGLNEDEVLIKCCHEVLVDDHYGTHNCILDKIMGGEDFYEYQLTRTVRGREVICLLRGVPYFSPDNRKIGIIVNLIDVTELKLLEREVMNTAEGERSRIGRDLHDSLGQKLTGLSFLIEVLRKKKEKNIDIEISELEEIGKNIQDAIGQAHSIAKGLCPVEMENNGLMFAIEEMAEHTEKLYNVSCNLIKKGNFFITDIQVATHFYYIAKEAVNNSIKHGSKAPITIELDSNSNSFEMTVKNEGNGAVPDGEEGKKGLGLRIMRYRAGLIGASIDAGNDESGGFSVRVNLKK